MIRNMASKELRTGLAKKKAANSLRYVCLKPEKEDIIVNFTGGRDVFVALPTGYGKRAYVMNVCHSCSMKSEA